MTTHPAADSIQKHTYADIHTHLLLATGPPVRQQQLHGANNLLPDGVQQGIPRVDAVVKQELHDLQVFVLDGYEEPAAAQRVQTVHIYVVINLGLTQGMFDASVVTWMGGGRGVYVCV